MKRRPAIQVETQPEWGTTRRFTVAVDQNNYELGVFSGRQPYLWLGPKDGPGEVLTVDVTDVKRLLRKAGHLT